jgi:hypothetical protein
MDMKLCVFSQLQHIQITILVQSPLKDTSYEIITLK